MESESVEEAGPRRDSIPVLRSLKKLLAFIYELHRSTPLILEPKQD